MAKLPTRRGHAVLRAIDEALTMDSDRRPPDFIELDRRFVSHTRHDEDGDSIWAEVLADREERRDWAWLLGHRTVALLAEAGAGKSYEFRAQTDRLNAARRPAFYLRIERLLGESIDAAFESTAQGSLFQAWRGSGREAVFFLDSVDEAKLPKGKGAEPLRDALATLERAVGSDFARSSVVISCRASEWHGDTEESHVNAFAARQVAARNRLNLPPDKKNGLASLTFAPLDRDRVRMIAIAIDSEQSASELLSALDAEQLWDEVRTPMDAVHFASLFAAALGEPAKRTLLRSRTAIFEASVNRRLVDGADSRSRIELSLDTAWKAASLLAFAVVVMEARDLGFDKGDAGALDATALLAEPPLALSVNDVRQLLATPLFTPAGRGRVRFYRPEIESMLAARFLEPQLGLVPATKLFKSFSATTFGMSFVPQRFGGMLAWLGARDQTILRLTTAVAPHFIIEDGDPRALATGDLISALERHVGETHRNLDPGFYFESAAIARFAEPELEPTVVALAQATKVAETRIHLLQMIRMGRYRSAADWVEHICGDGFTPTDVRLYAIRALIACGTGAHLRRLADTLLTWGAPLAAGRHADFSQRREDDIRIQLIGAAYPHEIGVDTMLLLLAQVRGREFSRDSEIVAALAERTPEADILKLLAGLERLAWASFPRVLFGHDSPVLTRRAALVFDGLSTIIARAVRLVPQEVRVESIDACFTASRYSRLDRDREDWDALVDALADAPSMRARMIQAAVDAEGPHHPLFGVADRLAKVWQNHPEALEADLRFGVDGYAAAPESHRGRWAEFLLNWVSPITRARHRRLAARLVWLALRHPAGIDSGTFKSARWHPFTGLVRRWRRFRMRSWGYRRRRLAEFWFERKEAVARPLRVLRRWKRLGEGKELGLLLSYLFEEDFDVVEQERLIERRGERLGNQLVAGTKAWVRSMLPDIRYKYEIRQLVESGLRWLHRSDPNFGNALTEPVKLSALQHYLRESGSPDPWVAALAQTDIGFWQRSAADILLGELAVRARLDPEYSNTSLGQLDLLPNNLQALMAPTLLEWAEANPVMARRDIETLADVVVSESALLARLVRLARRAALSSFWEGQLPRALRWLVVWAQHDVAAIDEYCDWLARFRGDEAAEHQIIMALGKLLGGRRGRNLPTIAELPSDRRLKIALLIHEIVRFEDDEPISEGVQTITPRREREDVRRAAQDYLGADYTANGRQALLTFIDTVIEPHNPVWAQDWRAGHAHAAGKRPPWTRDEFGQFIARRLIPPRNGDELAARIAEEIDAIAEALDHSEFDRRALLNPKIGESDFRAWLGHELDQRIQPWAAITQETVTRSEKRTDLRIELRHGDRAVLVVEIKLVHRWSRANLLDKIESQLANQYLIGNSRIRHGIYLLADVGAPLRGKLADRSRPDLPAFLALARADAARLSVAGGRRIEAQLFSVMRPTAVP
ncbi:hypothetical protein [Sphingopyxis sp. 550A]